MIRVLIAGCMLLAACSRQATRDDSISREVERTIRDSDQRAKESRTMSALAKLEEALTAYVGSERSVPASLDVLVPKYLAEIPTVELDVRGHRDNNRVQIYGPEILRDGQIDGSQLQDTGRWGYVRSPRQVVV